MRILVTRLLFLVISGGVASAQSTCPPVWTPGFGSTAPLSSVLDFAVHDCGNGPVLYAAALGVFEWRNGRWTALAPFPSSSFLSVTAIETFDAGNGHRLYAAGRFNSGPFQPTSYFIASWDGASWTISTVLNGLIEAMTVWDNGTGPALYVGGDFTLAGGVPAANIARFDGTAWTPLGGGTSGPVRSITVLGSGANSRLVAGGRFVTAGGVIVNNIAQWTGSQWLSLGGGVAPHPGLASYQEVAAMVTRNTAAGPQLFAAGNFASAGGVSAQNIAMWDGQQWNGLGQGIMQFSAATTRALAFYDSGSGPALYAGGWITGTGGVSANGIVRWDGVQWTALGTGTNDAVFALHVHDEGSGPKLFVGGSFSMAGGLYSPFVSRYDGTLWSSLVTGQGISSFVRDLIVHNDGSGESLFVGGDFIAIGSQPMRGVARWNGSTFLPAGTNADRVAAMVRFDSGNGMELHGGGVFDQSQALTRSVRRFDGVSWIELAGGPVGSPGFYGSLDVLRVYDSGAGPELYVGGHFPYQGTTVVNNLVRWTGSGWAAVANGVNAAIHDMIVFDDGSGPALFVGGEFLSAGFSFVSHVAKWDGTNWSPVGSGLGIVYAFAIHDDGNGPALYAGHDQGVSRLSGGTWMRVGAGMAGSTGSGVLTLHSHDDGTGPALYAGGTFTTTFLAPNTPTSIPYLVKWDGQNWVPLDGGMDGPVLALASFNDGAGSTLFAGGLFSRAGMLDSRNFAQWAAPRPVLEVTQPSGPGTSFFITSRRLNPNHEYFNLFSIEPCPTGAGTGPYGGLCASNPALLVTQLLLPVGSPPFHFVTPSEQVTFGPYPNAPGLTVEGICFDFTNGALGCVSPVIRVTLQ